MGTLETSYRFVAISKCLNKMKSYSVWKEILGSYCSPMPCLFPGTAWSAESCAGLGSPYTMEGKDWNSFEVFWPIWVFLKDWFLFCLTWSSGGNGGIVWILGWRPLNAMAVTIAFKSCREAVDLWVPGGERLWTEEYNRHLRPWGQPCRGRDWRWVVGKAHTQAQGTGMLR